MNIRSHPTFGKVFQRIFLRAWLTAAGLFAGALLLLKNDFNTSGAILAVGFAISIVITLGYLFYQLHHVTCPACGQETRTAKDPTGSFWVAHCSFCKATWDLGVGVDTSD